jgi:hypothetical protein
LPGQGIIGRSFFARGAKKQKFLFIMKKERIIVESVFIHIFADRAASGAGAGRGSAEEAGEEETYVILCAADGRGGL